MARLGPSAGAGALVVLALVLALAAPSLADGPQPAPPAAAAPAAPVKPVPEFVGTDMVRLGDGRVVVYYRVRYVAPNVLQTELDSFWKGKLDSPAEFASAGAAFVAAPPTVQKDMPKSPAQPVSNVLRVTCSEESWPVIRELLRRIDVPQPQVRIDAKVVEITWDDQRRTGVSAKVARPLGDTFFQSYEADFPNPLDAVNDSTADFRRTNKWLAFDYTVQAVEQGAKADVTARPSILASQGESAVIRAGDQEPYVQQNLQAGVVYATTSFKDVGIRLEVQPLLIGPDAVRVRVLAEASRLSDFRVTATSANQQVVNPVISQRMADTVVTVPNGETIVIGGLDLTQKRETKTGLPLLKDIPGLGYLFGSTTLRDQRSELMFYIKLSIERPEEARVFVPDMEKERVGR